MTKHAYIFDFDGVLVNTMETHFKCYREALAEFGIPIEKKQFFYQAGMTGIEQISYFAKKAGIKIDPKDIYSRKKEIARSIKSDVEKIECNLVLLRTLRNSGFRIAIATGSSRESVSAIMRECEIEVDAVVTADDVSRGKPNPDLFLRAAEELKTAPENCVVIEDADVGIEAAEAAGMKSMRFYDNGGADFKKLHGKC